MIDLDDRVRYELRKGCILHTTDDVSWALCDGSKRIPFSAKKVKKALYVELKNHHRGIFTVTLPFRAFPMRPVVPDDQDRGFAGYSSAKPDPHNFLWCYCARCNNRIRNVAQLCIEFVIGTVDDVRTIKWYPRLQCIECCSWSCEDIKEHTMFLPFVIAVRIRLTTTLADALERFPTWSERVCRLCEAALKGTRVPRGENASTKQSVDTKHAICQSCKITGAYDQFVSMKKQMVRSARMHLEPGCTPRHSNRHHMREHNRQKLLKDVNDEFRLCFYDIASHFDAEEINPITDILEATSPDLESFQKKADACGPWLWVGKVFVNGRK